MAKKNKVQRAMNQPKDLWDRTRIPRRSGYQHVKLQLTPTYLKGAKTYLNKLRIGDKKWFEPIFLEHEEVSVGKSAEEMTEEHKRLVEANGGEEAVIVGEDGERKIRVAIYDEYRYQYVGFFEKDLKKARWAAHLKQRMEEQLEFIHEGVEVVWWAVLGSKGGGKKQASHLDYEDWDFPRFAGIVAIEENTTVDIGTDEVFETIQIQPGEMVVFRGDVMHSGSAYAEDNKRIYFKAFPKGKSCSKGEAENVSYGAVCEFCKKPFGNFKQVYEHKRTCPAKLGVEEAEAKRKERNESSAASKKKRKMDNTK